MGGLARNAGALLLLVAVAGCGYRFVTPGSALPGGVRRVCAPVLVNRTAEPAAEALFTQALREGLVRQGLAAQDGCDATLRGELLAVSSGVGLAGPPAGVVSYRASATLRLTLQRGDEVLRTVEVAGGEDFLPGLDVMQTEANREAALHRLAQALAREALDRLTTGD
ncbi:MAG: LPS assembly lipoprotein LptE [Myxococcaceae bacterium]|nr:LPS assembly lipoprotein LptE [Myxococcaceae bacterium]MCI0672963.1 LPS assembly lipoprotein LptE [Myxococcaceae bacterium]